VTPARWPRPRPLDERLLVIDRARSHEARRVTEELKRLGLERYL